ncbi:MAG: GNAT family N-acetyltransferase [Planctomycetes bacterium RBG_16_55_9]|nr:MAG: GNAT family N-acetyltransferase [Planctomycetes bacterium RBG_16_55_9]
MSSDLLVRIGEHADAESLTKFNVAMAWETERKRLSPAVVARGVQTLLENPRHGFYVVAEIDHEVVGSLMVTYEWSDWRCASFWWIQSVYVKPELRKQSIFRRLYEFVKEKALQETNVCGFRLYVEENNVAAQSTYNRVGMIWAPYKLYEESFT